MNRRHFNTIAIIGFLLLCFSFSCKNETKPEKEVIATKEAKTKSALIDAFQYTSKSQPIISVHRGGKDIKNYPENCLETLVYVNDSIKAIYEIDIARTKDNVLVLMHDNTLNRTTVGGEGRIENLSYDEIKSLHLLDDFGNETDYTIPLFKDVLTWAKTNDVVLTIDIKRSVAYKDVINLIREVKAEDHAILITYNLQQAELAYSLAPELLLSVSARNEKELDWLLHSGIPTQNMLAFTGTKFSSNSFYEKIHSYGIKTILGTLGNLDKQAEARGDGLYKRWADKGIDIIATDRPFAVAKATQTK